LKDANGKYIDGTWTTTTMLTDAAKNVSTAATGSFVLDTTAPAAYTGNLKHDATNDTGINSDDSVTNNATPVLHINAETGANVEVQINGKTYAATETSTKGIYEVKVNDALPNATYNPLVRVTDAAGNTTVDGVFVGFTVAGSGGASGPISSTRTISILAISDDTGTSGTDFVTTDKTLKVNGLVTGVTATDIEQGKRVLVQFIDASGKEIIQAYVTPVADKWATTADTAELPVGKYTVKATIVDLAGNPFEQTSKAVEVTAGQLLAVADQSNVSEDHLLQNIGNVLSGTGESKQGADIDAQYSYGPNIVVNAVTFGATAITPSMVFSDTAFHLVDGNYGSLQIRSDGAFAYAINNTSTVVQSLQATQVEHDVFTYQVKNAAGLTSTATITVEVQGKNDLATILGAGPIWVDPLVSGVSSLPDVLKVQDSDSDQNTFKGISTTEVTQFTGTYGQLELTPTGLGYKWSYSKLTNSATDTIGHDLFVLESQDGTAVQTLDVQLQVATGVTASKQEFHTQKLAGLTVTGSSATTDTFVLHGGSLVFDFTKPTPNPSTSENIRSISNVEVIDIKGTGDNTIKLSMASLMQANVDATSHVKQLTINRDSGDLVEFKLDAGSAAPTAQQVNGYDVYHLANADQTATYDLLVQHTINTVAFS
jgi:VCBS repeat-containing protein